MEAKKLGVSIKWVGDQKQGEVKGTKMTRNQEGHETRSRQEIKKEPKTKVKGTRNSGVA